MENAGQLLMKEVQKLQLVHASYGDTEREIQTQVEREAARSQQALDVANIRDNAGRLRRGMRQAIVESETALVDATSELRRLVGI